MAYLNPNSFYSHYQAPRSSAFGGTLGKKKPTVKAASPAGVSAAPSNSPAPPQGFTVAPANLPPDPGYQQTIGALGGTLTNTLAGLTQARGAYLSSAGFIEDPTTGAITYDPNNPYSQAALLRQNYQQAQTGNTNSYAASGQLYSGALQNAKNATTDSFNRNESGLETAVQNFLANNTIQQGAAQNAYNTGAGQALGQSIQNAPNNPLYNPSAAGSGAIYSTDASGNVGITAGPGGTALVPQQTNSSVKLAAAWTAVMDANGNVVRLIPPSG